MSEPAYGLSKSDYTRTRRAVREIERRYKLPGPGRARYPIGVPTVGYVYIVLAGGITAATIDGSGNIVFGSGGASRYTLSSDGTKLEPTPGYASTGTIYNMTSTAVAQNTIVQCKFLYGLPFVDVAPC
jgi:hypothetical protein